MDSDRDDSDSATPLNRRTIEVPYPPLRVGVEMKRVLRYIFEDDMTYYYRKLKDIASKIGGTLLAGHNKQRWYLACRNYYVEIFMDCYGNINGTEIHRNEPCSFNVSKKLTAMLKGKESNEQIEKVLNDLASMYDNECQYDMCTVIDSLRWLEQDIFTMCTEQYQHVSYNLHDVVHNTFYGLVKRGVEDYQFGFLYFLPPEVRTSLVGKEELKKYIFPEDGFAGYVTILSTKGKYVLQSESLLSVPEAPDVAGWPACKSSGSMNTVPLQSIFIVKLNKPMPMHEENIEQIETDTEIDIPCLEYSTDFLTLVRKNGGPKPYSMKRPHTVELPGQKQTYRLDEDKASGALVHIIPFRHPVHLSKIIHTLRKQALFNTVFLSCLTYEGTQKKSVQLDDPDILNDYDRARECEGNPNNIKLPNAFPIDLALYSHRHLTIRFPHPIEPHFVSALFKIISPTSVCCEILMRSGEGVDFISKLENVIAGAIQRSFSLPIAVLELMKYWVCFAPMKKQDEEVIVLHVNNEMVMDTENGLPFSTRSDTERSVFQHSEVGNGISIVQQQITSDSKDTMESKGSEKKRTMTKLEMIRRLQTSNYNQEELVTIMCSLVPGFLTTRYFQCASMSSGSNSYINDLLKKDTSDSQKKSFFDRFAESESFDSRFKHLDSFIHTSDIDNNLQDLPDDRKISPDKIIACATLLYPKQSHAYCGISSQFKNVNISVDAGKDATTSPVDTDNDTVDTSFVDNANTAIATIENFTNTSSTTTMSSLAGPTFGTSSAFSKKIPVFAEKTPSFPNVLSAFTDEASVSSKKTENLFPSVATSADKSPELFRALPSSINKYASFSNKIWSFDETEEFSKEGTAVSSNDLSLLSEHMQSVCDNIISRVPYSLPTFCDNLVSFPESQVPLSEGKENFRDEVFALLADISNEASYADRKVSSKNSDESSIFDRSLFSVNRTSVSSDKTKPLNDEPPAFSTKTSCAGFGKKTSFPPEASTCVNRTPAMPGGSQEVHNKLPSFPLRPSRFTETASAFADKTLNFSEQVASSKRQPDSAAGEVVDLTNEVEPPGTSSLNHIGNIFDREILGDMHSFYRGNPSSSVNRPLSNLPFRNPLPVERPYGSAISQESIHSPFATTSALASVNSVNSSYIESNSNRPGNVTAPTIIDQIDLGNDDDLNDLLHMYNGEASASATDSIQQDGESVNPEDLLAMFDSHAHISSLPLSPDHPPVSPLSPSLSTALLPPPSPSVMPQHSSNARPMVTDMSIDQTLRSPTEVDLESLNEIMSEIDAVTTTSNVVSYAVNAGAEESMDDLEGVQNFMRSVEEENRAAASEASIPDNSNRLYEPPTVQSLQNIDADDYLTSAMSGVTVPSSSMQYSEDFTSDLSFVTGFDMNLSQEPENAQVINSSRSSSLFAAPASTSEDTSVAYKKGGRRSKGKHGESKQNFGVKRKKKHGHSPVRPPGKVPRRSSGGSKRSSKPVPDPSFTTIPLSYPSSPVNTSVRKYCISPNSSSVMIGTRGNMSMASGKVTTSKSQMMDSSSINRAMSPKVSLIPLNASPKHLTASPKQMSGAGSGKPSMSTLKSAVSSPSGSVRSNSEPRNRSSKDGPLKDFREKRSCSSNPLNFEKQCTRPKGANHRMRHVNILSNDVAGPPIPETSVIYQPVASQSKNKKLSAVIDKIKLAKHGIDSSGDDSNSSSGSGKKGSNISNVNIIKEIRGSSTAPIRSEELKSTASSSSKINSASEYMVKSSSDGIKITINKKTRGRDSGKLGSLKHNPTSAMPSTGLKPGVASKPACRRSRQSSGSKSFGMLPVAKNSRSSSGTSRSTGTRTSGGIGSYRERTRLSRNSDGRSSSHVKRSSPSGSKDDIDRDMDIKYRQQGSYTPLVAGGIIKQLDTNFQIPKLSARVGNSGDTDNSRKTVITEPSLSEYKGIDVLSNSEASTAVCGKYPVVNLEVSMVDRSKIGPSSDTMTKMSQMKISADTSHAFSSGNSVLSSRPSSSSISRRMANVDTSDIAREMMRLTDGELYSNSPLIISETINSTEDLYHTLSTDSPQIESLAMYTYSNSSDSSSANKKQKPIHDTVMESEMLETIDLVSSSEGSKSSPDADDDKRGSPRSKSRTSSPVPGTSAYPIEISTTSSTSASASGGKSPGAVVLSSPESIDESIYTSPYSTPTQYTDDDLMDEAVTGVRNR